MITLSPQTWERHLLSLAYEGRRSGIAPSSKLFVDSVSLDRAFAYCDQVTASHSKTFHAATSLLPREKRRAIRTLYAFCRVTDNIVDCPEGDCAKQVVAWRKRALCAQPPSDDPVAIAWADTRLRYRIPVRYAEQLVDGVARDLKQKRYQTFEELTAYAYGVAVNNQDIVCARVLTTSCAL